MWECSQNLKRHNHETLWLLMQLIYIHNTREKEFFLWLLKISFFLSAEEIAVSLRETLKSVKDISCILKVPISCVMFSSIYLLGYSSVLVILFSLVVSPKKQSLKIALNDVIRNLDETIQCLLQFVQSLKLFSWSKCTKKIKPYQNLLLPLSHSMWRCLIGHGV